MSASRSEASGLQSGPWYTIDRTFEYFLSPRIRNTGHILGLGFEGVVVESDHLSMNYDLSKNRFFQYHRDYLAEQLKKGYTLVIFVYIPVVRDWDEQQGYYDIIKEFVKAFNLPIVLFVSVGNRQQMWNTLKKMVAIKALYYVGPDRLSEDKESNQVAIANGAIHISADKFFPELPPLPKPDFDRNAYLASKTHFNIFAAEPIFAYEYTVPDNMTFRINRSMYQLILAGGTRYDFDHPHPQVNPNAHSNAYVFGPLFKLNEYKKVASHGNDGAQTGLIDNDLAKRFKDLDYQSEDPFFIVEDFEFDDPFYRQTIRDYYPQIIWTGETQGGDIGADVFAHYDQLGEIDGLIVDPGYFFVETEE